MSIDYTAAALDLADIRLTGKATCEGGRHPSPPLHHYPLLAWTHLGHPVHGGDVFTEDGKASVGQVAAALAECPSFDRLAERFGTSRPHVIQAVDYAIESGVLAR